MNSTRHHLVLSLSRVLPVTLGLLAAGITTIPCAAEPTADPPKEAGAEGKDKLDGFDRLYKLRLDYFKRQVKIYGTIKDEKSAEAAAKEVRALLPLQKSIHELTKELGQEAPEVYEEMQKKYGVELGNVSTKSLQQAYALAGKPYFKAVEIAQLKNSLDLGEPGAREALAMVEGGEAPPPEPAEVVAKNPQAKKAIEEILATTESLNGLLGGMKEEKGEERKERIAEAMNLAKKLDAQLKADVPGPEAAEDFARNQEVMKARFGPLIMRVVEIQQDPELAKPLEEVLMQIMTAFSDA